MQNLRHYIDAFSHLHTAKVKGNKAPHKAILLLAIIDLIEEGVIYDPYIELTDELVNKFNLLWKRYLGVSAVFTPDISKPFFHMQHESFWRLVEHKDVSATIAAENSLYVEAVKEKKELPSGSYSLNALRNAFSYAEIDSQLFLVMQNGDARAMFRVVLVNTYLVNQPTKTYPDYKTIIAILPLLIIAA